MILPRANNGMQLVNSLVIFSIALQKILSVFSQIGENYHSMIACRISQERFKLSR